MDTHVAVRFLGGVSNYTEATDPGCVDHVGPPAASGVDRPGIWCDLVTRDRSTGQLRSRFDLVQSRLDRFVRAGMDVLIVLDNVPWAFVHNKTYTGPCQSFGCQCTSNKCTARSLRRGCGGGSERRQMGHDGAIGANSFTDTLNPTSTLPQHFGGCCQRLSLVQATGLRWLATLGISHGTGRTGSSSTSTPAYGPLTPP